MRQVRSHKRGAGVLVELPPGPRIETRQLSGIHILGCVCCGCGCNLRESSESPWGEKS
jgi:hypothetical protein